RRRDQGEVPPAALQEGVLLRHPERDRPRRALAGWQQGARELHADLRGRQEEHHPVRLRPEAAQGRAEEQLAVALSRRARWRSPPPPPRALPALAARERRRRAWSGSTRHRRPAPRAPRAAAGSARSSPRRTPGPRWRAAPTPRGPPAPRSPRRVRAGRARPEARGAAPAR